MPDAGDWNERGVPKAVVADGAVSVGVVVPPEKLKNVVLTVATFEWLKMLKASTIRRTRMSSLKWIERVSRTSN